jgi:hypothetical protein
MQYRKLSVMQRKKIFILRCNTLFLISGSGNHSAFHSDGGIIGEAFASMLD